MITAIYTAKNYDPNSVKKRYVRVDSDGVFKFCEVGSDSRYDLRQGVVTEDELPESVALAAKERSGHFPSYVDWN